MKITDTTGRSLLVDLVYKDPQRGWLQAPSFTLKLRGTQFVRVPHGQYAIRICSLTGAEVIVHENGIRLIQANVPTRTQFINNDSNGRAFNFGTQPVAPVSDVQTLPDSKTVATETGATPAEQAVMAPPPAPIAGEGMVYVVVRMAREESPYSQPPQEEFEVAFQMLAPGDFEEQFAQNFHLVNQAPELPNKLDPMSMTPASEAEVAHRPCRHCVFTGHNH